MAIPAERVVAEFIASELRRRFPTSAAKKKAPGEYSLQQIADELGVTKPQVSDALKTADGIGRKFIDQFALKYYDGSIDAVRKAAAQWAKRQPAPRETVVHDDNVIDAIARVADKRGFTSDEASLASSMVRGFGGTSEMTDPVALELLERARGTRRDVGRMLGTVVSDSGGSALDDLGGGKGDLPSRRGRKT